MTATQPKSRGWRRMRELRQQDDHYRAALIAALTAEIGREPTATEALEIERRASKIILARILERRGQLQDALAIRDEIASTSQA